MPLIPIDDNTFVVQDYFNSDRYFVADNHYSEYMDYWLNMGDYTEVPSESTIYKYINARDIEGIYLFDSDIANMKGFWGRRTGGTRDTFVEIAEQIPIVKSLLEAGMGLDNIRTENPELVDCINIYFEKIAQVSKLGEFYIFSSNGRHREMAAQFIDGIIPVRITSSIRHKESIFETSMKSDNTEQLTTKAKMKSPETLNHIADKLESEIHEKFSAELANRLSTPCTNLLAKVLYDEYSNNIRIADYNYMKTPFYNSLSKSIKLNAEMDLQNPTGSLSTYFHEVGHMLDDHAGDGCAWLSSNIDFNKDLRADVDNYILKTMTDNKCKMDEAYEIISEELSGDGYAGISDIFGSLTNCRCQGDWGHHYTYWQTDPSRIEKEAFANMFEASIGDKKKIEAMKYFLPTAYQRFEYIIRSR